VNLSKIGTKDLKQTKVVTLTASDVVFENTEVIFGKNCDLTVVY
jgi:hypothetical protein